MVDEVNGGLGVVDGNDCGDVGGDSPGGVSGVCDGVCGDGCGSVDVRLLMETHKGNT